MYKLINYFLLCLLKGLKLTEISCKYRGRTKDALEFFWPVSVLRILNRQ